MKVWLERTVGVLICCLAPVAIYGVIQSWPSPDTRDQLPSMRQEFARLTADLGKKEPPDEAFQKREESDVAGTFADIVVPVALRKIEAAAALEQYVVLPHDVTRSVGDSRLIAMYCSRKFAGRHLEIRKSLTTPLSVHLITSQIPPKQCH